MIRPLLGVLASPSICPKFPDGMLVKCSSSPFVALRANASSTFYCSRAFMYILCSLKKQCRIPQYVMNFIVHYVYKHITYGKCIKHAMWAMPTQIAPAIHFSAKPIVIRQFFVPSIPSWPNNFGSPQFIVRPNCGFPQVCVPGRFNASQGGLTTAE